MEILLIKAGSTVSNVAKTRGDFERWFAEGLGVSLDTLKIYEVFRGATLPNAEAFTAIIVTGSASMVTEGAEWSLKTERWLARAVTTATPILGVCYGHQLLARALGGTVIDNPQGRQIGTIDVHLNAASHSDPLFKRLPQVMHVPVSHSQVVSELPSEAIRLAWCPADQNHAFAIGTHAWGVQFHPEFDANIVHGYIEARRTSITAEGLDADLLQRNARDTAHGRTLLRAFAELAAARS